MVSPMNSVNKSSSGHISPLSFARTDLRKLRLEASPETENRPAFSNVGPVLFHGTNSFAIERWTLQGGLLAGNFCFSDYLDTPVSYATYSKEDSLHNTIRNLRGRTLNIETSLKGPDGQIVYINDRGKPIIQSIAFFDRDLFLSSDVPDLRFLPDEDGYRAVWDRGTMLPLTSFFASLNFIPENKWAEFVVKNRPLWDKNFAAPPPKLGTIRLEVDDPWFGKFLVNLLGLKMKYLKPLTISE